MAETNYHKLADKLKSPLSLILDLTSLDKYFHDATEHFGKPEVLVYAECEADIIETVKFCQLNNIPITPRGAGTGLSGGCVPVKGGVLLSIEKMKKIEIDPDSKRAVCGPGVITKKLVDKASEHNLTYPPDPASYDESTLAGNVAENAGGLRCKKYGVTRDYVLGLKAVTIHGQVIKTGCYNNYQGFNLNDLIIGSEGTLVIITEIMVSLIEKPKIGNTILIAFDKPEDCARTVFDIIRSGLILTVMEFLDGDAAACSNEYEKNDELGTAAGILLLETSFKKRDIETNEIKRISQNNHCSYLKIEEKPYRAEILWKVRRNLSKASKALAKVRISEDIVVPVSKFPELVTFVAEMNKKTLERVNSFGHAGDGNLHVNFLSNDNSTENLNYIQSQINLLMKKTIELGGSLSGEHGIGIEKRKYLAYEFDKPTIGTMKTFKEIFDPTGTLNPDKIF